MAKIYPIVKYGDPVLARTAAIVTEFGTPELKQLLADMFDSMIAANGVGLAAPQIGISQRIAVIDCSPRDQPPDRIVLINPEILHTAGKQSEEEGCLSLPGFRESVTRPMHVTVRAQDAEGRWFERTGEDLLARAFLHETDHLHGRLFLSHLSSLKREMIKRKVKKLQNEGEW